MLSDKYLDALIRATSHEVQARLFLRNELGDDAYAALGEEQIEDLAKAIMTFREEPRAAVSCAGRAAEDFLRLVATSKGTRDYQRANGVGQIADLMKGEAPPLLLPAHHARATYVGAMRNAGGGHGLDKRTMETWAVPPEAALDLIIVSINFIRSVHEYAFKQTQVL